eukprot:TRINITY_DN7300_c0_g1_i2.p1 TRINITY_DN7300_c0_g1~~TRINITY_DN7300_c0_g1_i2.p1  ORF type:complete len:152 (-),score=32.62 TRINITY_DN7300_c0_g1_i2:75-530(-)
MTSRIDVRLLLESGASTENGQVGKLDVDVLTESQAFVGNPHSFSDSAAKKAARICAYLPDINSTNPIAAITNFCRRQLRLEVTFEAELSSEDSSDPAYCARVVLTDDAGFSAEYTYSKMEFATDQAADAGLKLLERAFIEAGIAATRGGKF